jgi:cytochrome c biogenesis protein CcmG/thiol:disulfide interchange protein DsbE
MVTAQDAIEPLTSLEEGRRRTWVVPALAAIAAAFAVGLVVLLAFAMEQQKRGDTGQASIPFRHAPDFNLGLFDGSSFNLQSSLAAGKPAIVNFWASWCVPCTDEAPVLQQAATQYADRFTFVGVDVEDLDSDAQSFLKKYGVTYPNGSGNAGPISVSYGMRGVPETYFIATDGSVIQKWNGPLGPADLNQFLSDLQRASAARPG